LDGLLIRCSWTNPPDCPAMRLNLVGCAPRGSSLGHTCLSLSFLSGSCGKRKSRAGSRSSRAQEILGRLLFEPGPKKSIKADPACFCRWVINRGIVRSNKANSSLWRRLAQEAGSSSAPWRPQQIRASKRAADERIWLLESNFVSAESQRKYQPMYAILMSRE